MTLRTRLLLAQGPLALALVVVGLVSSTLTARLGEEGSRILTDNYRSVLAAQKMKEALERVDSHTLFILAGHPERAAPSLSSHRQTFEGQLQVAQANITEEGERPALQVLGDGWSKYRAAVARFETLPDQPARDRAYFEEVGPLFAQVKDAADLVLNINQDAMVAKSERARRRSRQFQELVVAAAALATALGIAASIWLTTRMLRPLGVVHAAVRRFGQGDLEVRARVSGKDEIAALATDFNAMAEKLERYRRSSLGELLQAQQGAQAAIDGLPDPVLLMAADGTLTGANAASALLGIDPERADLEPMAGIEPRVRAVVDRLRAHVMSGKGAYVPRGFEDAIRVGSGEGERIFLPRGTPIYGEGGAVGGVATVFQDVTRLFRFDELKNNLVATVAHEFRTPLTSLHMAIHLCLDETVGPLTPKQADLLYAARNDCERLQGIVDELLNLSRIEAGHIDLHKRRMSVEALVDLAVDIHRPAAEDKRVALRAEILPGLPEVFVDADRLQLVFTNLLSNAIRYSPAGQEVTVRAQEERDRVRFEVVDQGPGIAALHQEALFQKFFRVPGSPEGGSGLGLFIARGIVQAHGGEIGVTSAPGQGATFWFTVPTAPRRPGSTGD